MKKRGMGNCCQMFKNSQRLFFSELFISIIFLCSGKEFKYIKDYKVKSCAYSASINMPIKCQ